MIFNPCFMVLVLSGVAGSAAPGLETAEAGRPARPNIVFILADDLGYGDVGCYGQTRIKTPSIDRLASEGMKFLQHYSGSPVCAPSRCTLLTGKHTGHAYIRDNGELETEGQRPLPPGTQTIGTLLRKAGYTTAATGKWGLGGPGSTGEPSLQGFDHFYGYLCQRVAHTYYPEYLWRDGNKETLEGNKDGKQGQYSHDLIAEEALKFIKEHKDRPFFLYVPFTIPHVSLHVPEDSLAEYKGRWPETPFKGNHYAAHATPRAAYAAMITRMDRDVGRILSLLKDLGLDESTIVFFTSDNGPSYAGGADARFFRSAGPLRGLKGSVHEGGIHVPFIARWPGRIPAGSTTSHVSAFWDVLPTLCEIAGAEVPEPVDGISFLPALLGKGVQKEHECLYWEYPSAGGLQAVRAGNWKGVRVDVKKKAGGPIQLYDLAGDPGETTDVAAAHPEVVEQIRKIMAGRTPSVFPQWNY